VHQLKPFDIAINERGTIGLYPTGTRIWPGPGYPHQYFGFIVGGTIPAGEEIGWQCETVNPKVIGNLVDIIAEKFACKSA
jgi:hypothetical protein